jgi:integrase
VITVEQLEQVLLVAARSKSPESGALKLLLSFFAGLRAKEIATLTIDAVADAGGQIGNAIWIASEHAKSGRDRRIPMHPRIKDALLRFRRRYPDAKHVAIGSDPRRRQSANAVAAWFRRIYQEAGLTGCSSHSGRRSFITNLARCANEFHTSLHDVQQLAGHVRLDTTQAYIEPSSDITSLVFSLGTRATDRASASAPAIRQLTHIN